MTHFDACRLEPYLRDKLGAEALSISRVWKNLEGWSMETYSLRLSYWKDGMPVEKEIILRKAPESGLMDHNYDVSIECRVLTAFNRTDVAVPKTYWYEADPDVLGRPFYAMEKLEGSIPYPPPICFDPDFRLIPNDEERRSLAENSSRTLP